jgi:hypothetical protein
MGLSLLGGVACGDPLKAPQLVEEPRVIGARVEVDGAPERATPAPGEGAVVRWLLGFPAAPVAMTPGFVLCPGIPSAAGTPECASTPFAQILGDAPDLEEPVVHFQVPPQESLGGVDRLVALALFCDRGSPVFGPSITESGCSDPEAQPLRASLEIGIGGAGADNRNPDLAAADLELDGDPWLEALPDDVAGEACAGDDTRPSVTAGGRSMPIALTTSPDDREALTSDNPLDPSREALLLSFLVTDGDLDHPYEVLEADDSTDRVEVGWKPPKEVPEGGRLIRFYFVARDYRGGEDWTERAVCVLP